MRQKLILIKVIFVRKKRNFYQKFCTQYSRQNFEPEFPSQYYSNNNDLQTSPVLSSQAPDFKRINVEPSPPNEQFALSAVTIAARSLLPKIQPEKFDGDISMSRICRKSYQSIIESNLLNDTEESKLVYLLNYL